MSAKEIITQVESGKFIQIESRFWPALAKAIVHGYPHKRIRWTVTFEGKVVTLGKGV